MIKPRELVAWCESRYPSALAEEWDQVGVIAGDWSRDISKVLLSVDITQAVLDEAIACRADCIVSHHPLVLPRHSIASQPYKYQLIARANLAGIFLFNIHTNADKARPGVADAMTEVLGVVNTEAIVADSLDSVTGTGRIGNLTCTVGELLLLLERAVSGSNPRTTANLAQPINRVALCPGAGDSLLENVRETDADVYITSDLRHHPASEHLEAGGCALIDIEHVAAERLWLSVLAAEMSTLVPAEVSGVTTQVWRRH